MSGRSMVAEMVEDLFARSCTPEAVMAAEAAGHDRALWRQVEELGLTLPAVPEELGGQGATLSEQVDVLAAAGRHAAPLPLMETGLLAGWLLTRAGLAAPTGPMTVAPAGPHDRLTLRRDGDRPLLSGTATGVPFASAADHLVVLARGERGAWHVALVDARAAALTPGTSVAGEPRDEVRLDGVEPAPDRVAPSPVDAGQLRRRAALGRSILMLGALEAVRDMTIAHTREREQFGRPLARLQVVQSMLAELARDVALARAAVDLAIAAAAADDDLPLLEVTSASVACATAAARASATAHQLHGAIGITREHALHLYTRRLWAWRDDGVPSEAWARRLGEALLDGTGELWPEIAPVTTTPTEMEAPEHA